MLRKVEPISLGCDVRIEGDHIAVTGLSLRDADLAGYLGEQSEVDRPAVVERGLKVGLIALRNTGVTHNVDFVAREFERLMHRTDDSHERAAAALDIALRETFAAKDGTLPRTRDGRSRRADRYRSRQQRSRSKGRLRGGRPRGRRLTPHRPGAYGRTSSATNLRWSRSARSKTWR